MKSRLTKLSSVFLSALAAMFLSNTSWFKTAEFVLNDTFYVVRGESHPPHEVVIVAIDEPSFSVLGMPWPWPRKIHADLIESLFREEASAVAFDVIFGEPSNAQDDYLFRKAISENPSTVLASNIENISDRDFVQQILTEPNQSISDENTKRGLANLPMDGDGFIRRLSIGDTGYGSLAIKAAEAFCGENNCKFFLLQQNELTNNNYEINFAGPSGSIKTVSYYQALEPKKYLPKDFFKDRLVFIGLVTGVNTEGRDKGHDSYPVPFTRWKGGYMSGVEIHANAASNIIKNSFLRPVSSYITSLSGLFIGIAFGLFFIFIKPLASVALLGAGIISASFFSYMMFAHNNIRIPLLILIMPQIFSFLTTSFINYWYVRKEKQFITSAFSKYLSPEIVEMLIRNPENLKPGGESFEATVMFLDFADFTTLSEITPPDRLIELLNRYLSIFTDIIFKHGGMIDKFIGDAVMAVWGVPVRLNDHAMRACLAAIDIKNTVDRMNSESAIVKGLAEKVSVRIGINTGVMTAGNVGGSKHFNYTVIGDAVNTASRVEGVNKYYGTTIMAGQTTVESLGKPEWCRFVDIVKVKGRKTPLSVYEITDPSIIIDQDVRNAEKNFQDGLELYRSREWLRALQSFRNASEMSPENKIYRIYSQRCSQFLINPPPDHWDMATAIDK